MLSSAIPGPQPILPEPWGSIGFMRNGIQRRKPGRNGSEPFGERLARLRKLADYTQRSLGEEIGISHRMVAYYEKESERAPAHLLPVIARALGVTVDQLLGLDKISTRRKPQNQRLLRKLRKVEKLSPRARRAVLDYIDALWAKEHGTPASAD